MDGDKKCVVKFESGLQKSIQPDFCRASASGGATADDAGRRGSQLQPGQVQAKKDADAKAAAGRSEREAQAEKVKRRMNKMKRRSIERMEQEQAKIELARKMYPNGIPDDNE